MHTHGVEILHGAHGDGVAGGVAHGLKLDFLPALDVALHQNLGDGRGVQTRAGHDPQLFLRVSHTAAGAAQGKSGTDDDGIADLRGDGQGVLQIVGDIGGDGGLMDAVHGVLEQLAVLRLGDGFGIGAQELDVVGLQEALLVQLHGNGQTHLAAETGQHGVGLFLFDDPLDGLGRQRLQIDMVRQSVVRHNGGGVGVHQHHFLARFLQHAAGLGAGIVKLRGLANDDGAGADDKDFFDLRIQRHD